MSSVGCQIVSKARDVSRKMALISCLAFRTHIVIVHTVADPGWWDSHPILGATLTTAVSGVYNAGRLGTGLGSRVFNRDTNVILVPYQLGK